MSMTKQATKIAQTSRLDRGYFEPHVSSPLRPLVLDPESQIEEGDPSIDEDVPATTTAGPASLTDEAENSTAAQTSGTDDDEIDEKKLDDDKFDDDDDKDSARVPLGDITHLLTIPANSKTFGLPQIARPTSHNFAPRKTHKVAEQGPEPEPSGKSQAAIDIPRTHRNNAASSFNLKVELPEQDENAQPLAMPPRRRSGPFAHRAGPSTHYIHVPSFVNNDGSPDHAEMARQWVLEYRKEIQECEEWNAESRKLMSMRGTPRGRRLVKKSGRISSSPLSKSETKTKFGFDLGEQEQKLDFEIFVDEDCEPITSSAAKKWKMKAVAAVVEDTDSISDFELPSPIF
ncbi:uncharacterized protein QC763_209845 [Podospora pseudopauciseta]|uniref:Uncharacterized protein n=1 Tax=Podospora pseudopauciseta TaxID=2093780 RepID=A0ABR0HQI1_9PEZI|nr:hypothetical protein QC763_209845 [Podospora pseudopauciseta]